MQSAKMQNEKHSAICILNFEIMEGRQIQAGCTCLEQQDRREPRSDITGRLPPFVAACKLNHQRKEIP